MDKNINFDDKLTAALERAPLVVSADDFSARLMTRLPKKRAAVLPAIRSTHWGRNVACVGTLLLVVALAIFGRSNSTPMQLMEIGLLVELCAMALWFAALTYRRR